MPDDLTPPAAAAEPPCPYPSLDELAGNLPPVAWLWPGWIPRGMITLLCAAPGAGKSFLALDLAHRLIAGRPFPDGALPAVAGANVIYVDAEGAPEIINERALAWGTDRRHLFLLLAEPGRDLDLNAPADQDRLLAMTAALRPALIVVDSLGSAGHGRENQVAAVGALFGFLHRIAVQAGCGLLLIHHLRKNGLLAGAAIAGSDVRGSGHIVSLARSVLGLSLVQSGLAPEVNGPRRLQILKTNLGPYPAPLGITFTPLPPAGVVLTYGPPPDSRHLRSQIELCAEWLLEKLNQGQPLSPGALEYPAHEAGFSRATLFRARYLLGDQVVDTLGRHHPFNAWTVPGVLARLEALRAEVAAKRAEAAAKRKESAAKRRRP